MDQAKLRCTENGVLFSSRIIHGPEGRTIVSFIQKNKFDLIVMCSHRRTNLMIYH